MKKRQAFLLIMLCVSLSGCQLSTFLPRASEPRNSAIVSVLGVEGLEYDLVRVYAMSQNRNEMEAVTMMAQEDSISHAIQKTRDEGPNTASYAHVEHLMLEEGSAKEQLDKLLSMSFQNGEQSIESKLWLLKDGEMQDLFENHKNLANQLDSLKTGAKAGTSLPDMSLRQVASRLFDDGTVVLPALRWENEQLSFQSYAVFQDGKEVVYLEDEVARSYAIFQNDMYHWLEDVSTKDGSLAVSMRRKKLRVQPQFEENILKGLTIFCNLEASLPEEWEMDAHEELKQSIETQLENEILHAVNTWQLEGVDVVNLRRKAGMGEPYSWTEIENQWEKAFSSLQCEVDVKVNLKHFF